MATPTVVVLLKKEELKLETEQLKRDYVGKAGT